MHNFLFRMLTLGLLLFSISGRANTLESTPYLTVKVIYQDVQGKELKPESIPAELKKMLDHHMSESIASDKEDASQAHQEILADLRQNKGPYAHVDDEEITWHLRPWELEIAVTIYQANQKYLSASCEFSRDSRGAHRSHWYNNFNYDIQKKKMLTLADLFPNSPSHLQNLSQGCRKILLADKDFSENYVMQGTEPTPQNFEHFVFTPKTVTICFQEYQVCCYALGRPRVDLERKAIC